MRKKFLQLSVTIQIIFFQFLPSAMAGSAIPTKPSLNESQPVSGDSSSVFPLLLQTFFALFLIIGFIYLLFHFLNKRQRQFFGKTFVRPLGGCSLGPQKSLQLVQIGSSIYIVGVGEDVSLIQQINDPAEVEKLLNAVDAQFDTTNAMQLPNLLVNFIQKNRSQGSAKKFTAVLQDKLMEARKQRERLKEELAEDREKGNKE
ncbi:flagellar biosynthetic protein FliO [Aneurinibacillus sp. Ricciae_BoGa-3]|uniref:flagellar biosynthetic protein FliO n=1 Tax=Aneurinibacillus sp. Ricciae_BoGa-3 TaxID=3022697 RepID=UPI002340D9B8|nr:flagellar biosynthetic protein FliO [Aneurinibacillus sp. Ricciae_BoGa-3]WCK52886.1 flagellar biosynthetic protein FliO [Aneurinibacillus sp. Ricciae_BoGa-3]